MKEAGKRELEWFDWFVPFYERAIPKEPPKKPTGACVKHAAMMAYDSDPTDVPYKFFDGVPLKYLTKAQVRQVVVDRIAEWAFVHRSKIRTYMSDAYNVMIVNNDGDSSSRGIRIVPNRSTQENIEAVRAQAKWSEAHCEGTHEREDFEAEQINRLQPKAAIERHKLVPFKLPAPKAPVQHQPAAGKNKPKKK